MAADEILQGRRAATIMHRRHRKAGGVREHHPDEMRRAARGGRRVLRTFGIVAAPLDEGRQRRDAVRHSRADRVGQHRLRPGRHRHEIAHRIVAQRPEAVRIKRDGKVRREQQRAAIGLGGLDVVDRGARGGAGPVLDDDRGRERHLHPLGHQTRNDVRAAAGGKADDDADHAFSVLRANGAAAERRGSGSGQKMREQPTTGLHRNVSSLRPFPLMGGES